MICKGYVEANNKFLKLYNPNKPTSYIIYLDANNFYGHCMIQPLPTEIINWVSSEKLNLDNYSGDGAVDCFLEVDLDDPDKLHELNNNYPLVAE